MTGTPGGAARWHSARTLAGLGELTAQWLEGKIGYVPGYGGAPPDEETEPLIPVLAAANRAGFVTIVSQPGEEPTAGYDGETWMQWVRSHRGELLAALLTIWRNWIAKGRPEADAGMGSFERWARAVGGALEAAGVNGFRSNTAAWLADSSADDDGWSDHLRQLRARYGDEWFTVADVAVAVEIGYLKRPPVKRDADKELTDLIGYGYRKIREKWHADLRLVRSENRDSSSGGRTWSVILRQPQTPPASSAWSGSSAGTGKSAGQDTSGAPTDHAGDAQRSPASSVGTKPVGQSAATDHTDHADHRNRALQRRGWPEGSMGAAAND